MDRMNKTASLPIGEIVGIQGPVITLRCTSLPRVQQAL